MFQQTLYENGYKVFLGVIMKPKIVDVIGRVLDEHEMMGSVRLFYRIFAKQLLKLYLKGHITFRIRIKSKEISAIWMNRFNVLKTKYGIKIRKRSFKDQEKHVFWITITDEKILIKCYSHLMGLSEKALEDIVERLKSYEEIPYII